MKLSQFNRILLQTLFLPVIALLCVSAVLVWQILRAEHTVAQMQMANRNIATAIHVQSLIVDEETGLRGFQNTANPTFLQPFYAAVAPLGQNFRWLRDGIAGQHGDLSTLNALQLAHQTWLTQVAFPMIAITRLGGNTRDLGLNLRAKASMDRIRGLETNIIAVQKNNRSRQVEHWRQQLDHTLEAIVGFALLTGLLIGIFAYSRLHLVSDAFQATLEEQRRTQAALLASEKLAVAGRLAATIAHEIHNPLDSVVNLLYLMKHGATLAERDEFVDIAQGELARVTQISRAMLGMYRESRTPVALDISEIVESVLVLLEHQMTQAGVSVKVQLATRAIVTGFPAELRQVFTNLLTNAAEASPPGSTIEVRVTRSPSGRDAVSPGLDTPAASPGAEAASPDASAFPDHLPKAAGPGVSIAIADHGPGIAEHDRPRLFHPFFTTKGEQGTGLGLWVSHGIVQKHNGFIHVETSTGADAHGTTVTVFLPRGEAPWPRSARDAV